MKLSFTKAFNILMALALVMFSVTANAQFSISKNSNAGAKKVISASITQLNHYVPGATTQLLLVLDLQSPDLEYADSIAIIFPAGFTVTTASNPFPSPLSDGQTAEALMISSGNMAVWGDNDNNIGGIEPGTHLFNITVSAGAAVSGPQTVNYYISGDEYGAAPNFVSGTFILQELPATPDLIVTADPIGYSMIPLNQLKPNYPVSGSVFNYGAPLTVNQNAVAVSPLASYNSTFALQNPLPTYSSQALTFAPISFSAKNTYNIVVGVPLGGDFDLSNNADTIQVMVTDTVMARDNGMADGGLGLPNNTAILGNMYELSNTGYMSGVTFWLDDPTAGDSLRVEIYNFSSAPTNKVAESAIFVVPSSTPSWFTVYLDQTITLVPGEYFVGVHQLSGFLSLGFTEPTYTPNTAWVKAGTGVFETLESNGFEASFMVRPFILSTAPLSAPSLILPANNATGVINSNVVLDWSDVTGASSYEYQYSTTSDFSANVTSNTTALSTATIPTLSLNTTYYWRARAVSSTAGTWSSTRSFTTIQFGVGVGNVAKNEVKIYPNPAADVLNLTNLKNADIEVYNILGAQMRSLVNVSGNVTVNVADLANGAYFVTVKSADFTTTKKITVNR